MRLLDLSNCKEYIDHALKYRMEKIHDDASSSTYSPTIDDISLSSVVLRGVPQRLESPEEESTVESSEKVTTPRRKAKSESSILYRVDRTAVITADQASKKGILHSENTAGKSPKGRVSFRVEENQNSAVGQGCLQTSELKRRSVEPQQRLSEPTPVYSTIEDEGVVDGKRTEDKVGVGVYMMVDRLRPGQCFVSIIHCLYALCVLNELSEHVISADTSDTPSANVLLQVEKHFLSFLDISPVNRINFHKFKPGCPLKYVVRRKRKRN